MRVNTSTGKQDATVWHYQVTHNDGYGAVSTDWKMTVTQDGVPVTLDMCVPTRWPLLSCAAANRCMGRACA
jgi:hypothetical protein